MLVALLAPPPAHAQSLDEVVNGVEATYGKIVDLRAEFTQTARNKSLGQDIKAEGIVLLKKGGKMRWDYKNPAPQQIVSDGTSLWVYTPELNQVNKGNAPKALAGPAGSFLSGLGRLREEFTVRFLNPASPRDRCSTSRPSSRLRSSPAWCSRWIPRTSWSARRCSTISSRTP
jgi:outer membrane lipoprotein carrier protein